MPPPDVTSLQPDHGLTLLGCHTVVPASVQIALSYISETLYWCPPRCGYEAMGTSRCKRPFDASMYPFSTGICVENVGAPTFWRYVCPWSKVAVGPNSHATEKMKSTQR